MTMTFGYAPTGINACYSANSTSWQVIATDGVGYASIAALVSAGKTAYPGLPPGGFLQTMSLKQDNGSGLAGSGFYYAIDKATAPTDDTSNEYVAGAGVDPFDGPAPHWNLWIRKIVGTDRVWIQGRY